MPYAKEQREFFDPAELGEWEQVAGYPQGIRQRVLSADAETGDHTRLLTFPPGIETQERLAHDFWEEVYIVDGSLVDKTLGQTFTKGMYACRAPGMLHGPYSAPEGCVTFEVRYSK